MKSVYIAIALFLTAATLSSCHLFEGPMLMYGPDGYVHNPGEGKRETGNPNKGRRD